MSSTQQTMTTALAAMEQALTDLAAARAAYSTAATEVSRAVHAAGGQFRQFDVEQVLALPRVDKLLAARLIALGLHRVLVQHKATRVGPDWVATLSAHIARLVP